MSWRWAVFLLLPLYMGSATRASMEQCVSGRRQALPVVRVGSITEPVDSFTLGRAVGQAMRHRIAQFYAGHRALHDKYLPFLRLVQIFFTM